MQWILDMPTRLRCNHPIRQFRQKRNLTLRELADMIGINTSTLHNLEYNRGQYTVRVVLDWCNREGVDPTIFFPAEPEINAFPRAC